MKKMFEPVWKCASKNWKTSLHNACPYLAMFPPALPNYFIEQFTKQGDIVLDPFSGRGTALLEAARTGRMAIGNDLNPLAYVLSKAKINVPPLKDINKRLAFLERNYIPVNTDDEPDDIKMLYDLEQTLPQLCYLKANLNVRSSVDNFIMSALMGVMHGKHRKDGTSAFLSISMPNTFSMSPNYIRKFISENGLQKLRQDVFVCLRNKIENIYPKDIVLVKGFQYLDNALNLTDRKYKSIKNNVSLIVTSPPYLTIINYGKYNWIRLWLLDGNSKEIDATLRVDRAYSQSKNIKLSDDLRLEQYLNFMRLLICSWENLLKDDGLAVVVIGDVDLHNGKYLNLAELVWERVSQYTSLQLVDIIKDEIDGNKKVTKIWGKERKGNATKTDKLLILSKTGNSPKPNIKKNIKRRFEEIYGGKL